jgi:general secretion pathway protein G
VAGRVALSLRRQCVRGFTLVELLVVMAILGVLAAAVYPLAEVSAQRERERELKRALWEIRDALDAYKRATDLGSIPKPPGGPGYPPSLDVLARGVADARVPGQVLYFLRRVPRDPFADPELPAEKSWGLRSHDSTPEDPRPGADVYDVHSQSPRLGLNGVPLRQW